MSEQYRRPVDPNEPNNAHAFVLGMVGTDSRVLELGCSVGHVTEHLVAAGNTVVGVEVDSDAAADARRFATEVHVLDLDVDTLAGTVAGPFDVVVMGDVLEHLRRPDRVLADAVAIAGSDARFVISVPNVAHADVRLMLLHGGWTYREMGLLDRTHLRWFTRRSLGELLAGAGLVATRVERVRIPTFATDLGLDRDDYSPDLVAHVEADPEAWTFQFVVEARRVSSEAVEDAIGEAPDVDWPPLASGRELDELRAYLVELQRHDAGLESHVAALETELHAWRNSRLARVSAPARRAWAGVRGSRKS